MPGKLWSRRTCLHVSACALQVAAEKAAKQAAAEQAAQEAAEKQRREAEQARQRVSLLAPDSQGILSLEADLPKHSMVFIFS